MPPKTAIAPVILAGMHRSGTSLVGSLLAAAGVDMGERLLAADRSNRHGYYEDLDFLALQRRLLAAAVAGGTGGHPDWGWVESGRFDSGALAAGVAEARALVARRRAGGRPWGWKDPRTSLLLEWWDELLDGEARYVLLYREPWEVAESMQRTGAAVWVGNPAYAWRIWCAYNERVLRFHARYRERALLVSARAVVAAPERFAALAAQRLGLVIDPGALAARRDPELLRIVGPDDPLPALWLRTHPDAARMLRELEEQAELPSGIDWAPRPSRLAPRADATLSVVIPCYDLGELLVDAVASVERTTPDGCELVIVDDGSRDDATRDVLARVAEHGYSVLRQENGGLASARNHGIAHASGRYLLPLDADNRLLPGFIAEAIAALDADPGVGVVYGDREAIGIRRETVELEPLDGSTIGAFLWCNWIDACAVMRRAVWDEAGGYDAGAAVWEDWELWISAYERGWRFHHLPRATFEYRVRPSSMLAEAGRQGRLSQAYRHIMRSHPELFRKEIEAVLLAGQREHVGASAELLRRETAREGAEARVRLVEAERRALAGELDALRHRLAFVESTRVWRWRRALLALRGRPRGS